mgnify:CR=1 FL=1
MFNSLFTFDLDIVAFHLLIGILFYFKILIFGISFLKLLKENLNPLFIYPIGLFFSCIISAFFLSLNIHPLFLFGISIFLLLINYKIILANIFNNYIDKLYIVLIVFCLVVLNSTTIHDPDNQNNIQAHADSYYYTFGIYSEIYYYKFQDLTFYDIERNLVQQVGILLAYPFKNFDLFKPILNYTISAWILSLLFVADILRENLKIKFISYIIFIFSFLTFFSFRADFYLDESLPTILTMPLIFLLSYFLFESIKKEKLLFEAVLFVIVVFSCIVTKQVLLFLMMPIILIRSLETKNFKIIFYFSFLIFLSVIVVLFLHQDYLVRSYDLTKISIPSIGLDGNYSLIFILNRMAQIISLLLIITSSLKNIKLLFFTIYCAILFYCTQSGGPIFFWLMLFIMYSQIKYAKVSFLNKEININYLTFFIITAFSISYYFFHNYHHKIGVYFLFFIFLFLAFNTNRVSKKIKILVLFFALTFPLSFSTKIPSSINFLIKSPLENRESLESLSENIEKLIPKNSIIFTDIGVKNSNDQLTKWQILELWDNDPGIVYLTQAKRQFYILSSYFHFGKKTYERKFFQMYENNENIIYKNLDPKKIIKNNYYKNFFILVEKEKLENIVRNKKNIYIINNNYILIEI